MNWIKLLALVQGKKFRLSTKADTQKSISSFPHVRHHTHERKTPEQRTQQWTVQYKTQRTTVETDYRPYQLQRQWCWEKRQDKKPDRCKVRRGIFRFYAFCSFTRPFINFRVSRTCSVQIRGKRNVKSGRLQSLTDEVSGSLLTEVEFQLSIFNGTQKVQFAASETLPEIINGESKVWGKE